jgi:hypothetical protein
LAAVHRNYDAFSSSGFGKNMMAAMNASQDPAMLRPVLPRWIETGKLGQ